MLEHRLVAEHAAAFDRGGFAHVNRQAVTSCSKSACGSKALIRYRIVDDAGNGSAFRYNPGADREVRFPADKGNRPIDGIDDEGERLRQSRCIVVRLFRQPSIVWS